MNALRTLLVPAIFALSLSSAPGASRYFPLDPGATWVYEMEGQPASTVVISVKGSEGGLWRLDIQGQPAWVEGTGDSLDILIPGEGFGPWYRFGEDSWLHRDLDPCGDGTVLAVEGQDETVETPAGTFTGCLKLAYRGGTCFDSGTVAEWWKEDVGRVRWVTESLIGERAWVLRSFVPGSPGAFLRGDANRDGGLDLSDAVADLSWLFLGGAAPGCLDAADTNDDGKVDLTDAISLLEYLYMGLAAPPPPGPTTPGYDPTPADPFSCGDPPGSACGGSSTSTLPGVRIEVGAVPCILTLAEAAGGVILPYTTIVDAALPGTVAIGLDSAGCDKPDASGIAAFATVSGGDQNWCLCDGGRCQGEPTPSDLAPGTFPGQIEWHGRNWTGPSDFGNPESDPFPPGTYQFQVTARGTYPDAEGKPQPYEIVAWKEFVLIP